MLKIIGDLLCAGDIAGILTKWAGNIQESWYKKEVLLPLSGNHGSEYRRMKFSEIRRRTTKGGRHSVAGK